MCLTEGISEVVIMGDAQTLGELLPSNINCGVTHHREVRYKTIGIKEEVREIPNRRVLSPRKWQMYFQIVVCFVAKPRMDLRIQWADSDAVTM